MTPEKFLNEERAAQLWARVRQKLDPATDAEVEELLDHVFGLPGTYDPGDRPAAADEEVEELLDELFSAPETK